MRKLPLLSIAILSCSFLFGQKIQLKKSQELVISSSDSVQIYGTLLMPKKNKKSPLVIIIAGSGPTDRNGNQGFMNNNSLKQLAEKLQKKKIATYRFDKRGIAKSTVKNLKESDLRFDHFIEDVCAIVRYFKTQDRFTSISIAGHSEGSLIGMIAAQRENADAFISIAGPGRSADLILLEQLASKKDEVKPIIDSLKQGYTVKYSGSLQQIFRESVQPYLISWFKYNPKVEIGKLNIPTLIVQGDNDLQVKLEDAKLLKTGKPKAEYVIVPKMNHVLKIIEGDMVDNLKSYYKPDLRISKQLIKSCTEFIQSTCYPKKRCSKN